MVWPLPERLARWLRTSAAAVCCSSASVFEHGFKGEDRRMADPMLVIARDKVAVWLRKYPKAATNLDGMRSKFETEALLRKCWLAALQVAEHAGWAGYGQETQERAEEDFERLIKEDH